jgi:ABC-2 type transport system ATP-binding protein
MEILRALRQMGKTIFISSHILSELAELCDSVTIIDRGQIRYSGNMRELLERDSDIIAFRLSVTGEQPGLEERLLGLDEVSAVNRIEESHEYRIECAPGADTENRLLAAVLRLEIPIEGFQKDLKHLNEAFMDLTEQGVS